MDKTNKGRGLITVVVVLSLIAFLGFSLVPLLDSILKGSQAQTRSTPTPTQTAASGEKQSELLQAQARGYELVLQREADNVTALRGLLQVRLELIGQGVGDIKDVVPPLEKLAKLNPETTEYGILLAQAKERTGDREGAAQAYRAILAAKPGEIKALQGLVNLLLVQQRPEAAIGLLQDTLKAAPAANQAKPGSIDTTSVQLILGQVYAVGKRFDEAIAIYDESAKANPKDFRPTLGKAIVFKEQGKKDEAKTLFAKATELAPPNYKDQINQLASDTPKPSPAAAATPKTGASPTPKSTASPSPEGALPKP
ncbi:MAG: tetratricopeptide repeat protein [Oscillatoriales cyanobacterium]|uniref:Tetratricopeptide repeat protein n=1 Tax=Microcoleus anatoxicus PTRS2 TaxID=2705321 RepID=A0ABU8YS72_9CYAN|nr:MAG: tetratricopeptide repeat protein [Oscillatoriales cyanobacterium]TAD92965.1 MAG: tetratricopeptide repeat protein [Oscillatoriales cyanobacterium]TAE02086.1 MAG: tetratricopeptide repeat protein [Oscillatoriales cyanobacterium]TAF05223.1 MAG: tetratricopeptide repeat protein [Oscillatoriales cyanobacterium]TAF43047.1 MAG: tetratricopeptide repeat protein [Oscillatoriales cyanobacterium]